MLKFSTTWLTGCTYAVCVAGGLRKPAQRVRYFFVRTFFVIEPTVTSSVSFPSTRHPSAGQFEKEKVDSTTRVTSSTLFQYKKTSTRIIKLVCVNSLYFFSKLSRVKQGGGKAWGVKVVIYDSRLSTSNTNIVFLAPIPMDPSYTSRLLYQNLLMNVWHLYFPIQKIIDTVGLNSSWKQNCLGKISSWIPILYCRMNRSIWY